MLIEVVIGLIYIFIFIFINTGKFDCLKKEKNPYPELVCNKSNNHYTLELQKR